MRLSWTAFTELLRCTLLGHLRNRLALVLAIAFIPIWIAVARLCTSGQVVHIRLDAISTPVSAPASQAGQAASALGAITMVAGFIAFTETFQSREMDRRLLLAGYPRLPILLAKLAAVALTAALLAFYTTILLWISLPVRHTAPLALALAGERPCLRRHRSSARLSGPRRAGGLLPHHHAQPGRHRPAESRLQHAHGCGGRVRASSVRRAPAGAELSPHPAYPLVPRPALPHLVRSDRRPGAARPPHAPPFPPPPRVQTGRSR